MKVILFYFSLMVFQPISGKVISIPSTDLVISQSIEKTTLLFIGSKAKKKQLNKRIGLLGVLLIIAGVILLMVLLTLFILSTVSKMDRPSKNFGLNTRKSKKDSWAEAKESIKKQFKEIKKRLRNG